MNVSISDIRLHKSESINMSERMAKMANKDTPTGITVDSNLYSLIVWAIGKFGAGVIIAIVAFYGLGVVYNDLKQSNIENNKTIMRVVDTQAIQMTELTKTLSSIEVSLKSLAEEAKEAHKQSRSK